MPAANSVAANLAAVGTGVRATAAAVLGQGGELFSAPGETFDATLSVDTNAEVPSSALLRPGNSVPALVRVGPDDPGSVVRGLCVKIPNAYGEGRDQDFLLASSGDGAPLHHAALPADPVAPLYSSLWLYLTGLQPVLFGVRPPITGPDVRFGPGDELEFLISPPVGRFRRIGSLTLAGSHPGEVAFSARNSGGNIRPLPPVLFY
ncbi:hypothetical protein JDV09_19200 [Mycobacterium sp. Y57]|uniref:hypothetical protein n=1 Tax=Mycolicibacterium xanthum TaxID=2796469 RepID=UPI001C849912|nr:hypothetical protein [Mycolicibacterium xanthum]MBX7434212.1 hypothetical protein [Mycolicibacterium xanthum]